MKPPAGSYIYLSPHLDDVVLSCGGTIYTQTRAGSNVVVVTFFAGTPLNDTPTPFAVELKERWGGASDPVAVRRAEDTCALATLGARVVHLGFYDCVYRLDPVTAEAYYPTVEHIFAEIHPAETDLPRALLAAFEAEVDDLAGATVYAPLGAGHHVDHLLVQRAALLLAGRGVPVRLYEDYPYAGDTQVLQKARALLPGDGWQATTVRFGEGALAAKGDAVACYRSQISTFWPSDAAMRAALRAQVRATGLAASDPAYLFGESSWEKSH